MDITKSINQLKKQAEPLAKIALLILVVVAIGDYFTNSSWLWAFGGLAFVATAVVLLFTYLGWLSIRLGVMFVATAVILWTGLTFASQSVPKGAQYQAVFLTNGSVYIGHLKHADGRSPVLENAHYLQPAAQTAQSSAAQTTQSQFSVVKLTNDVTGPESTMTLKSDQILFWENLKNSGKVAQIVQKNQ